MPHIAYTEKRYSVQKQEMIRAANHIIEEYEQLGLHLTLRQLYYQFVARDWIPNSMSEYKKLGNLVSDARRTGHIDWTAIEDRTRNVVSNPHWRGVRSILDTAQAMYGEDMWDSQEFRVELWVEKEALAGVFEGVCRTYDVPLLACRGYMSDSEMWAAAQRIEQRAERGQATVLLHFGDHDPSGVDMTRDIQDRLSLFGCNGVVGVERKALNMDQVERYKPPPNPAKITDSRATTYIERYGRSSWELDALDPTTLQEMAVFAFKDVMDEDAWQKAQARVDDVKATLKTVAEQYDE